MCWPGVLFCVVGGRVSLLVLNVAASASPNAAPRSSLVVPGCAVSSPFVIDSVMRASPCATSVRVFLEIVFSCWVVAFSTSSVCR